MIIIKEEKHYETRNEPDCCNCDVRLCGSGDIKAVQGDSGHSQVNMVTEVYSHIIDSDRKKNAELFENAFYKTRTCEPQFVREDSEYAAQETLMPHVAVPEGVDPELLAKVLSNPEMLTLLSSMAKALK